MKRSMLSRFRLNTLLIAGSILAVAAHPALLRGVTGAMVAVLDLDALARDPRIVVNEEVG